MRNGAICINQFIFVEFGRAPILNFLRNNWIWFIACCKEVDFNRLDLPIFGYPRVDESFDDVLPKCRRMSIHLSITLFQKYNKSNI